MNADHWFEAADDCLVDARILCEGGQYRGSCSRAYYAMFNACRGVLLGLGLEKESHAKTHSGLQAAINTHLVKPGRITIDIGRLLGREANRRLAADYEGEPISREMAAGAITNAKAFVAAPKTVVSGD